MIFTVQRSSEWKLVRARDRVRLRDRVRVRLRLRLRLRVGFGINLLAQRREALVVERLDLLVDVLRPTEVAAHRDEVRLEPVVLVHLELEHELGAREPERRLAEGVVGVLR